MSYMEDILEDEEQTFPTNPMVADPMEWLHVGGTNRPIPVHGGGQTQPRENFEIEFENPGNQEIFDIQQNVKKFLQPRPGEAPTQSAPVVNALMQPRPGETPTQSAPVVNALMQPRPGEGEPTPAQRVFGPGTSDTFREFATDFRGTDKELLTAFNDRPGTQSSRSPIGKTKEEKFADMMGDMNRQISRGTRTLAGTSENRDAGLRQNILDRVLAGRELNKADPNQGMSIDDAMGAFRSAGSTNRLRYGSTHQVKNQTLMESLGFDAKTPKSSYRGRTVGGEGYSIVENLMRLDEQTKADRLMTDKMLDPVAYEAKYGKPAFTATSGTTKDGINYMMTSPNSAHRITEKEEEVDPFVARAARFNFPEYEPGNKVHEKIISELEENDLRKKYGIEKPMGGSSHYMNGVANSVQSSLGRDNGGMGDIPGKTVKPASPKPPAV